MNATVCNIRLTHFFPFSQCGEEFCAGALQLGKCVHYAKGETILHPDGPAKHCGLILKGEAIVFNTGKDQHRFSVSLGKGCFIGLEALQPNARYEEKTAALSDIDILFWNLEGLQQLQNQSNDFAELMHILDEGHRYQKQNLVPENDISDPVLCSLSPNASFILKNAFPHILLALFSLLSCGILLRYSPSALFFAILLIFSGIFLFIKNISEQKNRRFILTSKNMILVPRGNNARLKVIPLKDIDTIESEQSRFERLFDSGSLLIRTPWDQCQTFSISRAGDIAHLMQQFGPQSEIVPADSNAEPHASSPGGDNPCTEEHETPFKPIIFHAHWAFLFHLLIKPLIFFSIFLAVYLLIGPSIGLLQLRRALLFLMFIAFLAMLYQFFTWAGNRFMIEEDRIWDYYKKPFFKEDLNVVMVEKIQSVRFKKNGFFQMHLNYGTVYILAGEAELNFNYVGKPDHIQMLIMNTCAAYDEKIRREEETRRDAYIAALADKLQRRE